MPKPDNVPVGTKFNMLTVIAETDRIGSKRTFRCRCDCGTIKDIQYNALKHNKTTSCGCYNKSKDVTHGLSRTHIFNVWQNMMGRCYRSNRPDYSYYGGRGIKVCEDWKDPLKFKTWADANGYSDQLTLERKGTDSNYEPKNCIWVDRCHQAANRRKRRTGANKYIGVSRANKKWQANICVKGVRTHLGVFDTPEEARDARAAYIKQHKLPHR
ncbi:MULTISPECIES: hypothetical protein [Pseudomonadota]|uniref:hypothetical protein n=1 Tax=Pseudomonadota TaxID=1224 RepID=UPI002628810E|nr:MULTISPECIES: hypothetical protein [Pseudomonadota]